MDPFPVWLLGFLRLSAVLVPLVASQDGAPGEQPDPRNCGPNALYAFLRLHQVEVGRQEVRARLPVGDRGCSLYEMQQCAASLGFDTEVVQATPATLPRLRLPAIVHTELAPNQGHYLVLVHLHDPRYPRFIDGTTGDMINWSTGDFSRVWSGYALVARRPAAMPWLVPTAAGVAAALGILVLARAWRRHVSRRRSSPASAPA